MRINVNIPCVRVEVRAPRARSGSLVLDLHELSISLNEELVKKSRNPRFEDQPPVHSESEIADWLKGAKVEDILTVCFAKALVAYSGKNETEAECFLSIHAEGTAPKSPLNDLDSRLAYFPFVLFKGGSKTQAKTNAKSTSNAILVRVPCVQATVSKAVLDGLQIWADDATQLIESCLAKQDLSATGTGSVSASTVSSESSSTQRSGASSAARREQPSDETIVKAIVQSGECTIASRYPMAHDFMYFVLFQSQYVFGFP
jgi:autophagy-related protein 2